MTNMSPFEPEDSQSSSDDDLGFDDFIGILVAFLTIGTILFWSLSRKESDWNFGNLGNLFAKSSTEAKVKSNQDNNLTSFLVPSPQPNNTVKSRKPQVKAEAESNGNKPILLDKKQADASLPPFLIPFPKKPVPPDFDKVTGKQSDTSDKTANNSGEVKPKPTSTPIAANTPTPTPTQTATATPTQTPKAEATPIVTANATAKKLPVIPTPVDFSDVPKNFWAKPFLDQLSSRGVIKAIGGDKTYKPNEPVNREGFADILQGAFESKINKPQKQFVDIEKRNQAAIKEAVRMGFMSGYDDKIFRPEQQIPREQVLVSLVSGLDLKAPASVDQVLSNYKDADKISGWAREKVATAIANNLVVNPPGQDSNSLNPKQEATRAEVAAMVHQALVKKGSLKSIKSPYIIKN